MSDVVKVKIGNSGMTITNKIDIPKVMRKIDDKAFWKFSAQTWWKLYYPYVPYDTGNLAKNVNFSTLKVIEHTEPYASDVYEMNAKFRTIKNANATRLWDIMAIKAGKDKALIKSMQNYIDSGRLKLND